MTAVIREERGFSFSDHAAYPMLTSGSGIPTNLDFTRTRIRSCNELADVTIYWKNNKH